MKISIQKLEKLADDLRKEQERMAVEVREGGKQSQDGFERVLHAAHKLHNFLISVPDELNRIVKDLNDGK